jgi:serine protease
MAAPHVAGLVALLLAQDPALSSAQVRARLEAASTALSATACNRPSGNDCGLGLVDAAEVLTSEASPPPPPPPPPPLAEDVPTFVVAFYCTPFGGDPCGDFDLDRSRESVVATTSTEVPFSVTGLVPGTYVVAAWQDLDQDLLVDEGEPFGFVPDFVTIAPGQVRSGIRVLLEPLTVTASSAALATIERHLESHRW